MAEVLTSTVARYDILSWLVAALVVFAALGMALKAWRDNKKSSGSFEIDPVQFLMAQMERIERSVGSRFDSAHRRIDQIENRVASLENRRR
jgi:hypothetical protein